MGVPLVVYSLVEFLKRNARPLNYDRSPSFVFGFARMRTQLAALWESRLVAHAKLRMVDGGDLASIEFQKWIPPGL